jgi:hypothetical protein
MNLTREEILSMPAGFEMDKLVQSFAMDGLPPVSEDELPFFIKAYSTNILAAWAVVERLKLHYKTTCINLWHDSRGWYCSFHFIDDSEGAQADTAPLAISRAALLFVLGDL